MKTTIYDNVRRLEVTEIAELISKELRELNESLEGVEILLWILVTRSNGYQSKKKETIE